MKNRDRQIFCLVILLVAMIIQALPVHAQSRIIFNGAGDYATFDSSDFPPPWTMEVWVYKQAQSPYSHLLTGNDNVSGVRLEQYINSNKVGITKAGVADWSFNYQVQVGVWTHLAITNNGSQMKLYANGSYVGAISGTIDFPMGSIGLNTSGSGALNAQLDELRIWNAALDAAVIGSWMTTPPDTTHPYWSDLLHYYQFDEDTGSVAHDSHGTLPVLLHGAGFITVHPNDMAASALVAPPPYVSSFSQNQVVTVRVSNVGSTVVSQDFIVAYALDTIPFISDTVLSAGNPIPPYGYHDISFPAVDLTTGNIHSFRIAVTLPGDQNPSNDSLTAISAKSVITLGNLTGFTEQNGEFIISNNITKLKIIFCRPDIFRLWLAPAGQFNDPMGNDIVVFNGPAYTGATWSDQGAYFRITTPKLALRVYKSPLKFALYRAGDTALLWEESDPLTFGAYSYQRLLRGTEEQFFGCGMQNGYFSHRGNSIQIENNYGNWGNGSVPNPAPFFMSSRGYGVFRNTFTPGRYDFYPVMKFSHSEMRYDAYYFTGNSMKDILEGYTYITGRPFLIPRWGLGLGDADCYNDNGGTTAGAIAIADSYRNNDMPGSWILPNDGYGCGYQQLDSVIGQLHNRGFRTGLWTEGALNQIPFEVGTAGVRLYKLDVALVGSGYKSALGHAKNAYLGIENNCDERGYVWTVAGWGGTQRLACIWTGDQYGDWENIRFHIPTMIGAGLSGFNYASGDVGGIFGGSATNFVRDLQWRCFLPALMVMNGWSTESKHPYSFTPALRDINRKYLKLRQQLTPYLYTYCLQAHETGMPLVRGMMLEFPQDPLCYDTTVQYQFMCGENLLVAPVYTNTSARDRIYLPAGEWTDYWDGTKYNGQAILNAFNAPIDKLPLFVKHGAVIPMYSEMMYDGQYPIDTLTLDIYSAFGYPDTRQFDLREDDGETRAYSTGEIARTTIKVTPAQDITDTINVTVLAVDGQYQGMPVSRAYHYVIHSPAMPSIALLNGQVLQAFATKADYDNAAEGWYYDLAGINSRILAKTLKLPVGLQTELLFFDFVFGVDDKDNLSYIQVFPSPARDRVFIRGIAGKDIARISISDLYGRELLSVLPRQADIQEIDISSLKPGVCYITLHSGTQRLTRKIVVL